VQTDTWYAVELKADLSTSNGATDGSYALWVNEDLVLEVTGVDTDWTLADYVYVGRGQDWNALTEIGTHFIDNVAVDNSYIGAAEYLVVRGLNNRIYYRIYNASISSWEDWYVVPDGATLDSPAAALYSGKLYIVVRSTDGHSLWFSWINVSDYSFSGWTKLSGSTESAPTLVKYGSSLVLVVRGLTNWIYYRFYDCVSGSWGNWIRVLGGSTIDSPAVAVLGDELHIVVRSTDGYNIWHSFTNMSNSEFSGWQRVGGATGSRPVLAASESGSELYLVVRGTNDRIYYSVWGSVVWSGWAALPGGSTRDGPSAVVIDNKLSVVVRGWNGTTLWYGYVDLDTSGFSGWSRVDGSTDSAPTLTRS
jgi:hypothetical protein